MGYSIDRPSAGEGEVFEEICCIVAVYYLKVRPVMSASTMMYASGNEDGTLQSNASDLLYNTLVETVLPMQVDCVAWCRKLRWVVAIGAYQLDASNSANRVGRVYLVVLKPNLDRESGEHQYITSVLEEVSTSGVLDLKWEPQEENLLAVGTSNSITIFRLDFENGQPILEKHKEYILENDTMTLYLEWMKPNKILIGDSNGSVQIFELTASDNLERVESRKFHEFLVWVVHYSHTLDTIYSGADDGKFFAFYAPNINESAKHVVKKFDVGVTSITTYKDYLAVGR